MDVMLQKHGAKHIYQVPAGLRELCTDISREVLRSQPRDIYSFISEYADTLLITRENTKVAVKVVNNILLGSEAILNILYRAGFSLEQIAIAAPRLQNAFRQYLDAVDTQPIQICEDHTCDDKSKISIRNILEATGATYEDAERAATIIQAAFRGHYERMVVREAEGKVQWQRAVTNTLDILERAGATEMEISKAARHIQYAYRGYYARRNQRMEDFEAEEREGDEGTGIVQPAEAMQAVAWLEMMYEDSGLTIERANDAALIIQKAYKKYRARRSCYEVHRLESSKSMVVEAILDHLRESLFEKVITREDIPTEYGTREDMVIAGEKLRLSLKETLRRTRIIRGEPSESEKLEEEESYEDEDELEDQEIDEMEMTGRSPESESAPLESEVKSVPETVEEQSIELETDDQEMTESEVMPEDSIQSPELESESEADLKDPEETEFEEEPEVEETEDGEEHKDTEHEEHKDTEHEEHKHGEHEEQTVPEETSTAADANA